jgi:putative NADH-flavin reductase
MRIVVLGASGGCGRIFVRLAAEAGHEVTAVVRPTTPYDPPSSVRVVRAEVLEDGALVGAIANHEIVISSVGMKRVNPKNPWSDLASPPDIAERLATELVRAMHANGIERAMIVSAAGVGESVAGLNWMMRFLLANSNVGKGYRDLEQMERIYKASDLSWILVRPVTLTDGPEKPVREVPRFGTTNTIARSSVARWMLDHIPHFDRLSRTAPMIAHA